MLSVVKFLDGKYEGEYGLQNAWTGILLHKSNGKIRHYSSKKKARKAGDKIHADFAKTITRLMNRDSGE